MATIEFHGSEEAMRLFPRPYPASRAVPQWLKAMPMDHQGDEAQPTVKRCPPLLEAITAGYIIPLAGDCSFTMEATGVLQIQSQYNAVAAHHKEQYAGAPFARTAVVKFRNPWLVRTPSGYSTLFVAPLNRFEIPFIPLNGVVETDTFYSNIHFPAICTLAPGASVTLPSGTPIIQAIPFRREAWDSRTELRDESRRAATDAEVKDVHHAYKDRYWIKHEYE